MTLDLLDLRGNDFACCRATHKLKSIWADGSVSRMSHARWHFYSKTSCEPASM